MKPNSYHTIFLMFDRPDAQIGDTFDVEILQEDVRSEKVTGGMSVRIEIVPQPEVLEKYRLKLWTHKWRHRYTVVRASLLGTDEQAVLPDEGAKVELYVKRDNDLKHIGKMRWHRGWRTFYAFLPGDKDRHYVAFGYMKDKRVAKAETKG
jgi:hypothetical protein